MRRLSSFLVVAIFALLTFGLWAYLNRPNEEPPWPKRVQGFALAPYREGKSAVRNEVPTEAEIDQDLALLSGKATAVRTYQTEGTLASIPRLAEKHHLKVTLGAWLDTRQDNNERELRKAIDLANSNENVIRLIIGNESILREDLTVEQMITVLDRVRKETRTPVST